MLQTVIIIVLVVLVCGLATIPLVEWWMRRVHWTSPVPGFGPETAYSVPSNFNISRLEMGLKKAALLLCTHTHWLPTQVASVTSRVKLLVHDTEEWQDTWGREVAGLQELNVLHVGYSLAALCHELAHLCESSLEARVDVEHLGWPSNGVQAAVDAFEAWTIEQGWKQ